MKLFRCRVDGVYEWAVVIVAAETLERARDLALDACRSKFDHLDEIECDLETIVHVGTPLASTENVITFDFFEG